MRVPKKRPASKTPNVVASPYAKRWLRGLQIFRRLLAPLGHDIVADLPALHESAHAGALDRADVHEHVLAAVARRAKPKGFFGIEELHGTCGHHGFLAFVPLT